MSFFPKQTLEFRTFQPKAFRRFSFSLVEMAIVTGVVCDAVSGPDAGLWLWYSIWNEPEPKPWSGRSANSLAPPESTLPLPAETPLKLWLNPNVYGKQAIQDLIRTMQIEPETVAEERFLQVFSLNRDYGKGDRR